MWNMCFVFIYKEPLNACCCNGVATELGTGATRSVVAVCGARTAGGCIMGMSAPDIPAMGGNLPPNKLYYYC